MKWEVYNALKAILELAKSEAPIGDVRDWTDKVLSGLVELMENPDYDPAEEN